MDTAIFLRAQEVQLLGFFSDLVSGGSILSLSYSDVGWQLTYFQAELILDFASDTRVSY